MRDEAVLADGKGKGPPPSRLVPSVSVEEAWARARRVLASTILSYGGWVCLYALCRQLTRRLEPFVSRRDRLYLPEM